MTSKRAALYLWVSTASKTKLSDTSTFDQDPAVQEQPLPAVSASPGGPGRRASGPGAGKM